MIRPILTWSALTLIAGATAFAIGHEVIELEKEQSRLVREIAEEQQRLAVLRAEWAHLNAPQRLRRLAETHTDLRPTRPSQLTTLNGLMERLSPQPEETTPEPSAPVLSGDGDLTVVEAQPTPMPVPERKPVVDDKGVLIAVYNRGGDPI